MALSTLARTARVLLGVHVVAVTLFSLLLHERSLSGHDWVLELQPLAPLDLSASQLVGSYGGTDSRLRLEASGEYQYRGGFWSTGYCETASVYSSGTWERTHTGIRLVSTDEAGESFSLSVWRTEESLCLTPRPGTVLVDAILRRRPELPPRERPAPRIPPGVHPR